MVTTVAADDLEHAGVAAFRLACHDAGGLAPEHDRPAKARRPHAAHECHASSGTTVACGGRLHITRYGVGAVSVRAGPGAGVCLSFSVPRRDHPGQMITGGPGRQARTGKPAGRARPAGQAGRSGRPAAAALAKSSSTLTTRRPRAASSDAATIAR